MDNNYGYNPQPQNNDNQWNNTPNQTVYTQDPMGNPEPPKESKGMAIASMVCGILSITLCCGNILFAIVAVVLGIISIKKPGCKGMALAGIICGGIGIVFGIIALILTFTGALEEVAYNLS